MSINGQYNRSGKFLHFLRDMVGDRLKAFRAGYLWPTHVVVAPTSRCQLKCAHCVFANRAADMSLPLPDLCEFLVMLAENGTRAIEYTGGEPFMYPHLGHVLKLVKSLGMKQGVLTNGLALKEDLLEHVTWVRVSLDAFTCQQTVPHFEVPSGVTVTGSYIWSVESTLLSLELAVNWARYQNVQLRVVPDAYLPLNSPYRKACTEACRNFSDLYYEDARDEHTRAPDECVVAWLKPMLGWDGWVYACCYGSSVLWEERLVPHFRVSTMDGFEKFFQETPITDLGHRCENCFGWEKNNLIAATMAEVTHPEFH